MKTRALKILFGIISSFIAGCNVAGLLLSPGVSDIKVPAEFDLADRQQDLIAIKVDQLRGSNTPPGIKKQLTAMINGYLVERVKINSRYLINGGDLSPAWAIDDENSVLTPEAFGQKAGAGIVLVVRIEDFKVTGQVDDTYYAGHMKTRSFLVDVSTGDVLWPVDEPGGRRITAKVDIETKGREMAVQRLLESTGHCLTRHLYNCQKVKFKSADEDSIRMEAW